VRADADYAEKFKEVLKKYLCCSIVQGETECAAKFDVTESEYKRTIQNEGKHFHRTFSWWFHCLIEYEKIVIILSVQWQFFGKDFVLLLRLFLYTCLLTSHTPYVHSILCCHIYHLCNIWLSCSLLTLKCWFSLHLDSALFIRQTSLRSWRMGFSTPQNGWDKRKAGINLQVTCPPLLLYNTEESLYVSCWPSRPTLRGAAPQKNGKTMREYHWLPIRLPYTIATSMSSIRSQRRQSRRLCRVCHRQLALSRRDGLLNGMDWRPSRQRKWCAIFHQQLWSWKLCLLTLGPPL